jgi:catechol 2,3-dioxygenase-like lactoylglutathione lyase family enzyme
MNTQASRVSPVRAVILNVASMDDARRFYEDALGMDCLGETREVDPSLRSLWGLGEGRTGMACMGLPQDPYARVEIVSWEGCTGQPLRDRSRVFSHGILTLNLRTPDIEKALGHLAGHGATIISRPVKYPYREDVFLYEAMALGPHQERYTLLQIGEAQPLENHVIGDVVATVGTVVPDTDSAKRFYADVLRLNTALEMDEPGDLFAPLLGVAPDFRMRMTLFTSGDSWTGKLETIEFSPESESVSSTVHQEDWRRTGYCMLSLHVNDSHRLMAVLEENGFSVEKAAQGIERPFVGRTDAFITRAPGGIPLEVLTYPGETS